MPLLDHVSISAAPDQYQALVEFYLAALKPLGIKKLMDFGVVVGLGAEENSPEFWIAQAEDESKVGLGGHICFTAKGKRGGHASAVSIQEREAVLMILVADRASVRAFHKAAVKAGGKDHGKPGLRKDYHPNYYGGYITDPAGHRIEAVCHCEEGK